MTKEKHHETHPAKPKAKKEPARKPHAEEQPYYEEPPEDHPPPPPPPLPTGQEPQAPAKAGEPQAPAGSRLEDEQKAGQDAVAKAEQGAHNKPPPHEEGT